MRGDRFRVLAASVLILVGAGCAANAGPPSATPTPAPVDAECYAAVGFLSEVMGGTWTFGAPIPAPSDQPWVVTSDGCRYRVSTDASGYKSADLDPAGCFGIDPSGSAIVPRPDFCSPAPSPT